MNYVRWFTKGVLKASPNQPFIMVIVQILFSFSFVFANKIEFAIQIYIYMLKRKFRKERLPRGTKICKHLKMISYMRSIYAFLFYARVLNRLEII